MDDKTDKIISKEMENPTDNNLTIARDGKTGQFLPGHRPISSGRPKNAYSFTKTMFAHLERHPEDGLDSIIAAFKQAKQGNMVAINTLWERADGKVAEKREFEPIPIQIIFKPAYSVSQVVEGEVVKELPVGVSTLT